MTLHLFPPAFEALAAPLLAADLLGKSELYAAHHLGLLAGEARPWVLLAAALALRAPGLGHTGADLAVLHDQLSRVALDRTAARSRATACPGDLAGRGADQSAGGQQFGRPPAVGLATAPAANPPDGDL
jgi:hypothetical protein